VEAPARPPKRLVAVAGLVLGAVVPDVVAVDVAPPRLNMVRAAAEVVAGVVVLALDVGFVVPNKFGVKGAAELVAGFGVLNRVGPPEAGVVFGGPKMLAGAAEEVVAWEPGVLLAGVLGWKLKVGFGAADVEVVDATFVPELAGVLEPMLNTLDPPDGLLPPKRSAELFAAPENSELVFPGDVAGVDVAGFEPKSPPVAGAEENRFEPTDFEAAVGGGPAGVVEANEKAGLEGVLVPLLLDDPPNRAGLFKLPKIPP